MTESAGPIDPLVEWSRMNAEYEKKGGLLKFFSCRPRLKVVKDGSGICLLQAVKSPGLFARFQDAYKLDQVAKVVADSFMASQKSASSSDALIPLLGDRKAAWEALQKKVDRNIKKKKWGSENPLTEIKGKLELAESKSAKVVKKCYDGIQGGTVEFSSESDGVLQKYQTNYKAIKNVASRLSLYQQVVDALKQKIRDCKPSEGASMLTFTIKDSGPLQGASYALSKDEVQALIGSLKGEIDRQQQACPCQLDFEKWKSDKIALMEKNKGSGGSLFDVYYNSLRGLRGERMDKTHRSSIDMEFFKRLLPLLQGDDKTVNANLSGVDSSILAEECICIINYSTSIVYLNSNYQDFIKILNKLGTDAELLKDVREAYEKKLKKLQTALPV